MVKRISWAVPPKNPTSPGRFGGKSNRVAAQLVRNYSLRNDTGHHARIFHNKQSTTFTALILTVNPCWSLL